jgi:SAM-dependent methyltransferase
VESVSGPEGDVWGEDENARRYEAYAQEFPGYRETSRELVTMVLPQAGADAAVLDLACGTGATTREILAGLGPGGRVTGVDRSAAMLKVAASSTADPRVRWVQADAETVDQRVTGLADAVICNSAIWQTDFAATALAVRAVINEHGRFAFNVPAGFFGDAQPSADRYPALLDEMRAIAEREYGWVPAARAAGPGRPRLTRESIGRFLADARFDVELVKEVSYQHSAESQRAWLTVPIFTRDPLAGLGYEDRMRVLDLAWESLGPAHADVAQWVVFVARPGGL